MPRLHTTSPPRRGRLSSRELLSWISLLPTGLLGSAAKKTSEDHKKLLEIFSCFLFVAFPFCYKTVLASFVFAVKQTRVLV